METKEMQSTTEIVTLFVDIGEVLLMNRCGRESRHFATDKFKLDFKEFDIRHTVAFKTYI